MAESQRKYMTGEWFYEAKSQRHQDRIHGSEIIWASMRQRRADFTRSVEKPRRGSAVNDVMAMSKRPSQQPMAAQEQRDRNSGSLTSETPQDTLRIPMCSPKLRHNPFNSVQVDIDTERPYPELQNRTQGSSKTYELESPSSLVVHKEVLSTTQAEPRVPAKRPAPVPRKRTKLPRTQRSHTDSSGSGVTSPTTSVTSMTFGEPIDSHLRSEPMGGDGVPERESVEVRATVERRQEKEEELMHVQTGGEEKRHFIPVPVKEGKGQRRKSEEITEQHRSQQRGTNSRLHEGEQKETTPRSNVGQQKEIIRRPTNVSQQRENYSRSNEDVQRETSSRLDGCQERETTSRSNEGVQRETTSRLDGGQQIETTPLTNWPQQDAGRRLDISAFVRQEEWKPSGSKSFQDPRGARTAWSPSPDQMSREKEPPQSSLQRWKDSHTEEAQPMKPDQDIRVKVPDTASLKAAEDTLHESKRTFPSSALDVVAKPGATEKTKSPQASATQTSKLSEEGDSIAKVLEWFNRSTDSSNRQDTDSAQDPEDTKDDITDSEEEAKMMLSKTSVNVYTIVPRQEKAREKKKLFPDETCWGKEQSVDLSDEGPEQSEPQTEAPTITVRPFQPGLSRDTTRQLHTPAHVLVKPEAIHQPQHFNQSRLQTETSFQAQRSSQLPIQTETSYHPEQSNQSSFQTETSYQPQQSNQSSFQTETSYQPERSNQSQFQKEMSYQSQCFQSSPQAKAETEPNQFKTLYQSKHPINSAGKTEATYQSQRPLNSTTNREMTVQTHPPVHAVVKTETVLRAQQHRPDAQRHVPARVEDVHVSRGPETGNEGNSCQNVRCSQQESQTSGQDERPKIANLRSFWEKGNSGPKILISRTNINTDKKIQSDQRLDIGQTARKQVEDPQKAVQNFEIRSMSPSLNPHNESPQRKQVVEIKTQGEKAVDDISVKQKYINVEVVDKNIPEGALCTARTDSFEVSSYINKDVSSSEVKSPPLPSSNSRFAKKVAEEAMKHPYTAHEPPVLSTHLQSVPKAEAEDQETPSEPRSQSRTTTPVLPPKQETQHFENRRERLKQLKSFWENEVKGPKVHSGKSRESSGSPSCTLTKRFTKSAFDLRSTGLASNDDFDDDVSEEHSCSVFAMKDKPDKPCLADTNFKSLKDFWAGSHPAQARPKSPTSKDRLQSHAVKSHEMAGTAHTVSPQPWKPSSNQESWHSKAPSAREEPLSSTSTKSRHRGREEGGTGGGSSQRSSVDGRAGKPRMSRAEPDQRKAVPQHQTRRNSEQVSPSMALVLKNRSNQTRRTSTGNLNERAGAMRRATSMYSLAYGEDQETSPKPSKKNQELGATKSKKTQEFGLSFAKKAPEAGKSREQVNERRPSRTMEDPDWQQPLARSFIPRDYQHYLGIPERTGTCPAAPPLALEKDEVCTSFSAQPECEWSHGGGPVRCSTPVGAEEAGGRRGSLGPRPCYGVRANEDSPRSSTSGSWISSRKNSKCDEEEAGPVQRALRRAAARPTYTKSLEDITMATGPERESEKCNVFMHSSGDASTTPSTLASSFSDAEHLRKMSKSVPSFLQEDARSTHLSSIEDDSDSMSAVSSSHGDLVGRRGVSFTNHSISSGMASVSSVSGSVMSVCSGEFGGVEVQGTIQFTLNYVQKLKEFHIFVVQCKNLTVVDPKRNRSDPYVKSYLIPDKAGLGKRKTSVKKRTVNPIFNEILRYRVRMDHLKSQVLNLSVWHHDTFGKNIFLGEVELDLSVWDFGNTDMNYMSLKARVRTHLQYMSLKHHTYMSLKHHTYMSLKHHTYSTCPSNTPPTCPSNTTPTVHVPQTPHLHVSQTPHLHVSQTPHLHVPQTPHLQYMSVKHPTYMSLKHHTYSTCPSNTTPTCLSNTTPTCLSNTTPTCLSNTTPTCLSNTTPTVHVPQTPHLQYMSLKHHTYMSLKHHTYSTCPSNTTPTCPSNTTPTCLSNTTPTVHVRQTPHLHVPQTPHLQYMSLKHHTYMSLKHHTYMSLKHHTYSTCPSNTTPTCPSNTTPTVHVPQTPHLHVSQTPHLHVPQTPHLHVS
ncbi:hypothetical protein ACEWY4_018435 [Coilia grayii]|uniref:C2 domain-containing protein n=1 Tax=Coilia grayii TaxID=363190 RepID=A0ABD1JD63_9TELE